jgi:hypothetical protein
MPTQVEVPGILWLRGLFRLAGISGPAVRTPHKQRACSRRHSAADREDVMSLVFFQEIKENAQPFIDKIAGGNGWGNLERKWR